MTEPVSVSVSVPDGGQRGKGEEKAKKEAGGWSPPLLCSFSPLYSKWIGHGDGQGYFIEATKRG
jgi:hypothetical protein